MNVLHRLTFALGILPFTASTDTAPAAEPNIVIIYADDLGYGDLSCQGATKLKTPHIDQLAAEGRRFTDAHSASATCTPSRYAMLSGKYPWRENLWSPVFLQSPLVLKQDSFTLADLAKSTGHATAIIGKWHLGFGDSGRPDWNENIKPGPLELGFDQYFGVPVVNSHPPFVYVEDHRVIGLDPTDPIIVSGHEDDLRAMNELHALHHDGAFTDCTLWDAWLPMATLWASEKKREQYRASFLNRRIDAEGYVSMQQHRGMAHSAGWAWSSCKACSCRRSCFTVFSVSMRPPDLPKNGIQRERRWYQHSLQHPVESKA